MSRITFFVPGQPVPQGSKSGFVNKNTGRVQIVDKDVRLPQWRMKVTAHAMDAVQHHSIALDYPLEGPVGAQITFRMPRPKGHYGTGRNAGVLKDSAPRYPASMPDLDKLLRAIFDALTDAHVWRDDGQVVFATTSKQYAEEGRIGVEITVGPMTAPEGNPA
jgi:crossover junction endodeoxyribonuclease RusA